jgi:hypothetical protein
MYLSKSFLALKGAFTYADLYAVLENGDKVLWFTPGAAIMPTIGRGGLFSSRLQSDYKFSFNVTISCVTVICYCFRIVLLKVRSE